MIIAMLHDIDRKIKHKKFVLKYFIILTIIISFETILMGVYLLNILPVISVISSNNSQIMESKKDFDKIEAKKREPVYINLPGSTEIRALVENYNDPTSLWTLVNKSHPISPTYVPTNLVSPDLLKSDAVTLRNDTIQNLKAMFNTAKDEGVTLIIASAYRSYDYQNKIFSALAASVGTDKANQSIALPGQSEHQTGLALDIASSSSTCYIETCFSDTSAGQWLAQNSYKFGFILRYPEDKEKLTQYIYEPWHFRYVGKDLAGAIYRSGLTLDEAWPYLQKTLDTLIDNKAIRI
jgi:D-alanyl-D-alanine carboxypeptidase